MTSDPKPVCDAQCVLNDLLDFNKLIFWKSEAWFTLASSVPVFALDLTFLVFNFHLKLHIIFYIFNHPSNTRSIAISQQFDIEFFSFFSL